MRHVNAKCSCESPVPIWCAIEVISYYAIWFGLAMPSLGLIPTSCLNHLGVLHLYLCGVDCLMRKTECIETLQILLKKQIVNIETALPSK